MFSLSAQAAREQLHSVQAHILGAILNDVPVQRDGYYTYYTTEDGRRTHCREGHAALPVPRAWMARLKKRLGMHP